VGNAIYIFGGHRGTQQISRGEEIKTAYKYDPLKNTYTQVADMPESGIFIVSAYYKGDIYAIPGIERTVNAPKSPGEGYIWADGLLRYNPAKDVWTKLNVPRPQKATWLITQESSNVAIGSKLYFGGGGAPPDRRRTDTFMYYDMDAGKFVVVGRLPKLRSCAGGGVIDGKLYIVAGFHQKVEDRYLETWGYPFPGPIYSEAK
jgi:N-acetylneuraminic acid mutarotase